MIRSDGKRVARVVDDAPMRPTFVVLVRPQYGYIAKVRIAAESKYLALAEAKKRYPQCICKLEK